MNTKTLKRRLQQELCRQSGWEVRRDYLGMSSIGQCPRQLYHNYIAGRPIDEQSHWFCWTGYLHEDAIVRLLTNSAETQERGVEVVADFDDRFRGHVDLVLDGDLVEIKSTGWDKFQKLRMGEPPRHNVEQVQMYLCHGGWDVCHLVYVARDVPPREWQGLPFWTFEIRSNQSEIKRLNAKAKRVLLAIDRNVPPVCECGRCRDSDI